MVPHVHLQVEYKSGTKYSLPILNTSVSDLPNKTVSLPFYWFIKQKIQNFPLNYFQNGPNYYIQGIMNALF